jgi:hypothetical protein
LSPSYSGSTLLTFLLGQHPSVTTIGELKASAMGDITEYICACGEPILACTFWQHVSTLAKQRNLNFDLAHFGTHFRSITRWKDKIMEAQVRGPLFESIRHFCVHHLPGLTQDFAQTLRQNQALIEICVELQGGSLFIDGSKDPHRLKYLIESDIWDIYVLEMVRDGRAQTLSAHLKVEENLNYEEACAEWAYTIKQIKNVRRYIPPNKHYAIQYETLCVDPNTTMNHIWDFVRLPGLEQDWHNVDFSGCEHHILGNDNMRQTQQVKIKLDEKWRSQITTQQLDVFNNIAGATNQRLGYK